MKFELFDVEGSLDPEFEVTNPEGVKRRQFTPDGIYSERIFGRLYGNSHEHSCRCRELMGVFLEGTECPKCRSKVRRRDFSLSRMGWIDLHGRRVFNPLYASFLRKLLRPSRWARYVDPTLGGIDDDGNPTPPPPPPKSDPLPELAGVGVGALIERLDEVLDASLAAGGRDPAREELHAFLKANMDCATTGRVPIYAHRLRPALIHKDDLVFDRVNSVYTQILKSAQTLASMSKERIPMAENALVHKIQALYDEVHDHILKSIEGKDGWIRQSLLGNRLNFSARCVITPIAGQSPVDVIRLPYLCAIEFLRLQIVNYLTKLKGMTYGAAARRWAEATTKFDPEMYGIAEDIRARMTYGMQVLLNRNPTINIGSILQLEVTDIKTDYEDYTMDVSNNILKHMAGDYDGDVLNVYLLLADRHVEHFAALNPTVLTTSPNDGGINPAAKLDKDHMVGVHQMLAA